MCLNTQSLDVSADGKGVEPLKNEALLNGVAHGEQALMFYSPSPLSGFSLLPDCQMQSDCSLPTLYVPDHERICATNSRPK